MYSNVKTSLELTLAILKPNVSSVPYIVKDIRRRILDNGFFVLRTRKAKLNVKQAHEFYVEHREKFFYKRLVTFMSSGFCFFHILARENAIESWRTLMGPTKVYKTIYTHPNTIRGLYGLSDTRNATHGSDSSVSAEKEIRFFFPDFEIFQWHEREQNKLLKGEFKFDSKQFIHKAT